MKIANIDNLKQLQEVFEFNHDLKIKLAAELEFYLIGSLSEKLTKLNDFFSDQPLVTISKEDGEEQFEIVTEVFEDAIKLAEEIRLAQTKLTEFSTQHNLNLIWDSYLGADNPPNSLHINISLHKNEEPLFYKQNNRLSDETLFSIQGLLLNIKNNMDVIAPTTNCKLRFTSSYIHTPKKICWGYNNRTACIRVMPVKGNSYRIEYRVCSSKSNIINVLGLILLSLNEGLTLRQTPGEPIYGNSSHPQYELDSII